jgi:hypothetical protein
MNFNYIHACNLEIQNNMYYYQDRSNYKVDILVCGHKFAQSSKQKYYKKTHNRKISWSIYIYIVKFQISNVSMVKILLAKLLANPNI